MNIALIAHDSRKKELIEWLTYNYNVLVQHSLFATGTTGKLIKNITVKEEVMIRDTIIETPILPFANNVNCLLSGPLGGDQQIGAMIAEGKIDMLIFFCDNLISQGHQTDVSALSRLASLYNIAFATNRTTADFLITSVLMNNAEYQRIIPECIENYNNRRINN